MRWSGRTAGILVTLIVAVTALLTWTFWTELTDNMGQLSTTLRNIGLLCGGAIAIVLTMWRSSVSERQTKISQQQTEISQQQIEISQQQVSVSEQSLLNQRYERGAEMLGNEILTVRIGGIYALANLANEEPKKYHIPCIETLCAFVRHPTHTAMHPIVTPATSPSQSPTIRSDIQAAMTAIGKRSKEGTHLEEEKQFQPDLSNANLQGVVLGEINFERVLLTGADLSHAQLQGTKLKHADLRGAMLNHAYLPGAQLDPAFLSRADFSDAVAPSAVLSGSTLDNVMHRTNLSFALLIGCHLNGVDLTGAKLQFAILSNATITQATGLTQAQLDSAYMYPNEPPTIVSTILDPATNKPLVWRGLHTVSKPFDG